MDLGHAANQSHESLLAIAISFTFFAAESLILHSCADII